MSFRRPITILRRSIGVMGEDGYYKPGSTSEMTIRASVQPLNTNEYTLVAAEGSRNVGYVKIYTDVPLQTEKEIGWNEGMSEADILLWQNRHYKVVQCDAYQSNVINHYKSIAKEVMPDDE